MVRSALLAVFLFATPVFAQDAGSVVPDAGTTIAVVLADGGVAAAHPAFVLPTPTVQAPDQNVDMNFISSTALGIKYAAQTGDWGNLVFLVITALVVITRKVLVPRFKWLQTQLAPTVLSFLWASAGALASVWPAGKHLTAGDVYLVLQAGIMAAGGFHLLEAVLKHFMPTDPTQRNWATVLYGWLIVVEPIAEKALPQSPPPPPSIPPVTKV